MRGLETGSRTVMAPDSDERIARERAEAARRRQATSRERAEQAGREAAEASDPDLRYRLEREAARHAASAELHENAADLQDLHVEHVRERDARRGD
jgi:hypothetical protein